MQFFVAVQGADFQTRQVAHLSKMSGTVAEGFMAFEHPLTLAVLIILSIILTPFAVDQGDALQFVAGVPLQGLAGLYGQQVAVAVEQCVEDRFGVARLPAHATVAGRGNAHLARVAGTGSLMDQFSQVASRIVGVDLGVVEAVFRIDRLRQPGNVRERAVVVTTGADQPVQRVVAEIAVAVDELVGKPARCKGVVVDSGNVADRVVKVFEILQGLGVFAAGLVAQATIGRIVSPAAAHPIARQLFDDLPGGVVLRVEQYCFLLCLAFDQQ
ncbi:hypothetical protein [Pseudomonas sp. TH15]|uniref:hypothetical protein n=1 Tax=Pseudomonas sp. TH15 TaxID=2796381 RepID=UPI001F5B69CC|nr:hypothetical protein [Pseudomonas sp. TH15]